MIIYCQRDDKKKVNGLFAVAQFFGQEQIDDQSPEVLAYQAAAVEPSGIMQLFTELAAKVDKLKARVDVIATAPAIAIWVASHGP